MKKVGISENNHRQSKAGAAYAGITLEKFVNLLIRYGLGRVASGTTTVCQRNGKLDLEDRECGK